MTKAWFLSVFLFMLGACAQPVKDTAQTVPKEKSRLDGVWQGSFDIRGRGPYDFHAIHVGGRSTAVSHKAKAMCAGKVSLDKKGFYYAQCNLYVLDGSPFDYATITGVLEGGHIDARFVTLNGGDSGTIRLTYNKLYEQPSSLAFVQGHWRFVDGDGLAFEMRVENNAIRATDSDGCEYAGHIEIINPEYNAYNIMLNIDRCDSVNGQYQGLAYVDNVTGTYLRVDIVNQHYAFHYDFQKQPNTFSQLLSLLIPRQ